uniref:Uncharacterized protein n=1 Tax=Cannabis sativa TaxID=3483 RepID=A0A803PD77_CANSA
MDWLVKDKEVGGELIVDRERSGRRKGMGGRQSSIEKMTGLKSMGGSRIRVDREEVIFFRFRFRCLDGCPRAIVRSWVVVEGLQDPGELQQKQAMKKKAQRKKDRHVDF